MAYTTYSYFTRKQCNVLFKAFKRGDLTPPKDCRGKVKRPGFVYDYEGCGIYRGWYLDMDQRQFNGQLMTLMHIVGLVIDGELEKAQAFLDGTTKDMYWFFPDEIEPKKMWKVVR